ncbi:MAG: Asp-tRNA(Asn)/Glu-tRNA(Gln) amidotransferase subunit GatA [Chloroherpetonaceae bacterium]|nr:Asp-tRNA(Asn)/Glu-tRNA(Gln) amidotransferase subunit GatA [Chloroherpetonaceae bacterium]MDW8436846.1 Asp-tRNA(Asn)/Glu-tRNA(Gln) amidotransferase subunit GatA [Chloroherpetonaceae bacterium]
MSNLVFSSYRDLREKLLSKSLSVESVVSTFLARIEEKARLNAYLSVFKESALARARELDAKLASGKPIGKLFGLPLAVKDNIAIKGEKLTCASRILENFTSVYSATAIERLLAEDAVILGKTNLDEFAMGSSNENSAFGAAKNPINEEYVPGGSSGGSAAAVAADLALVALGSDTGGSVRQPASFCDVVGIKPTYGRVSRYGLVAFGSSFDQIGVLSKTVEDAALALEVIAGEDPMDSTSSDKPVEAYASATFDPKRLRIGVPKEFFADALDKEINAMIRGALEKLQAKGAMLVELSLPHSEYALATYYILATAEASSNLARYDGARYGYRAKGVKDMAEMYVKSRSEGFGREVKRRIMLGTYVLSAGYYDAYYRKAQKVRRLIRDDYLKAFEQVDVIASPTSPVPPFKFGEKMTDPLTMYLADIYTVPMNLAGVPAISVPIGRNAQGLPIGLQLIGNLFAESTVFAVAKLVEESR